MDKNADKVADVDARANVICDRNQLTDGGLAVCFQFEFDGRIVDAFAVAFDDEVFAYTNICPHRGTPLDWQPGDVFDESGLYLICATHGAIFSPDTGFCVGGPCQGASLKKIAITVKNELILLNIGRLIGT